jgi:hypothetical protein
MLTPAPVQTAYQQYINWAQNGMIASETGWDIDTKICEDQLSPNAGIGFGVAVTQGSLHGSRSACLGQLSGGSFLGITAADPTLLNVTSNFTDKYADGENMAVLVRGDIWVIPKEAVTAGQAVYFDAVTGQLSNNSGDVLVEDARWMTDTSEALAAPWAPSAFPSNNFAVVRLANAAGGR